MTKEVRLLFLATLTLTFYAVSIYLSQGAIIFPFPLNELILLIISIQFSIWNRKNRASVFFVLGISLFAFLGNEIYWSFIIKDHKMYHFSTLPITDIFKLLSSLCIIGFGIYILKAQKHNIAKLCSLLFLIFYISSITYFSPIFLFYGLIIMTIGLLVQPVYKPFHLFWTLLLILESTKFLTITLNN